MSTRKAAPRADTHEWEDQGGGPRDRKRTSHSQPSFGLFRHRPIEVKEAAFGHDADAEGREHRGLGDRLS